MPPTSTDFLPSILLSSSAMLFNSPEYLLLFLPITVLGHFWLNRHHAEQLGKIWLAAASLFFYGWWSIGYLWLIGGSILFNFFCAQWIARQSQRRAAKRILCIAIFSNLLLLGYYKYTDFFINTLNPWITTPLSPLHLALPLGISFFTFTQLAFLVDTYYGKVRECKFIHYSLFVTYFPHLIAGPILHHSEMMPQFSAPAARRVNWENIQLGLFILAVGLLKKVVLADSLAASADIGFNAQHPPAFLQAWFSSLSYTLQLYFDFSGYTDMAIGASLLFNIRLPENFNSPYKALNIRNFWQRWHITLSRWLRDYLYIPLGGSRHGELRMHAALLITFLLGGLWHGANWTFIIWGCLHGFASVVYKLWQRTNLHLPRVFSWLTTFLFVNFAWVFFRADNITLAKNIIASLLGFNGLASLSEIQQITANLLEPDFWNPLADTTGFPARQVLVLCLGTIVAALPNTQFLARSLSKTRSEFLSASIGGATLGTALFYMLFLSSGLLSYIYFYF